MRLRRLSIAVLLLLSACATPEYQAERAICEGEWMQRIPPVYRQQMVERIRYEERPTGRQSCKTKGNVTKCVAEMTRISIPYVTVETVDGNAGRREVQIDACVARACQKKFGNPECKPPGG
ncbi:MAG: hypothetical protein IE927_12555 [Rhodobacterales bacterium]|nr:hypothetical protein [Rhodobacterales bacterium]